MKVIEKTYKWAFALSPRSTTTHVILHHAAALNVTAGAIHTHHLSMGWAGIAYHYFVSKTGQVTRGRPENMRGAHTTDWNYCSIGICFEGNFEHETMPAAQKTAGRELVADILSRCPAVVVGRHQQYGATACPGKNFPFNAIVNAGNNEPAGTVPEGCAEPDEWAKEACARAVDKGLFIGDGNSNFRWRDAVTRQELAAVLMRYDKI